MMKLFCDHKYILSMTMAKKRICDNKTVGMYRVYICEKCLKKKKVKF